MSVRGKLEVRFTGRVVAGRTVEIDEVQSISVVEARDGHGIPLSLEEQEVFRNALRRGVRILGAGGREIG